MHFREATISAAFEQHRRKYASGERGWDVPHHIEMWQTARRAFEEPSFEDFERLYRELKSRWQVFRGAKAHWTARQSFERLRSLDPRYGTRRLSTLGDSELGDLWLLLEAMPDVKTNKYGPSVVAVSKFLHFWNPKLFVIVDYGVIWSFVLEHGWLWRSYEAARKDVDQRIFGKAQRHSDETCDLRSYLAILAWAGRLARDNPGIMERFAEHVGRNRGDAQLPPGLSHYDGAAVEWFLLGVVEISPPGIGQAST